MAEGLLGKFKMMIGVEDVEEEEEEEFKVVAPVQTRSQPAAVNEGRRYPSSSVSYEDRSSTFVQPKMDPRNNKVVSMQNTTVRQQFKLVVTEPKSFDECPKLVDSLKSRKPVIIKLEKLENEKARKIFDFLSGATYALNGNVQKVANNIFVFAPDNVDVLASSGSEPEKREASSFGISPWRR